MGAHVDKFGMQAGSYSPFLLSRLRSVIIDKQFVTRPFHSELCRLSRIHIYSVTFILDGTSDSLSASHLYHEVISKMLRSRQLTAKKLYLEIYCSRHQGTAFGNICSPNFYIN